MTIAARARIASLSRMGPVVIGGARLRNPFMTASGTSGHDVELGRYMDLQTIGAVVTKSLFHEPWQGNPAPRVHTAKSAMMNAVGLQGPGVEQWCQTSLPRLREAGATVVTSIWGRGVEEYRIAARLLGPHLDAITALEVNLSCPNLEGRAGIIAHDADTSARVTSAVKSVIPLPLWVKLSANTDRICDVARAVVDAGADALTVCNTLLGLQVDVETGRPTLGNGGGGLSGPAIHPVAVRAVFDVKQSMPDVDIVGVGGVSNGRDALEMMMVGATGIQVGTASFARPDATLRIAIEASQEAKRLGMKTWDEVRGRARIR